MWEIRAGKIAHQAFQHLQFGDDLLLLGQAALFELAADLAQPRAGFMQRGLEFQMALSQMSEFLGDTALVAASRETRKQLLHEDKTHEPDKIATGQPVNRASPAPSVAQTNNTERVRRTRVMAEIPSLMAWIIPATRFQSVNQEKSADPAVRRLRSG